MRVPSVKELPLLTVLALVGVGLSVGARGNWRVGAVVLGAALLLGAGLRLLLPARRAGLLVVRGRQLDVATLLLLGLGLVVLAATVPAS